VTTTETALRVSLELDHAGDCFKLAAPLLEQMQAGPYDRCSVMEIPHSIGAWLAEHRTARKRTTRSGRRGYIAATIRREEHEDAIYAINRSAHVRQGRPMSAGYLERQTFSPLPDFQCPRHAIRTTGILSFSRELVGYLTMYRCGDLALVSQILGHADHLADEIMYQLFAAALSSEIAAGPGVVVYNRHDSGTDGLRFYKERLGFEEVAIEWER
jgi:hypothetical protein